MAKKEQIEQEEVQTDAVYIEVDFELKSKSPLIMCRDDVMVADALESARKSMGKAKKKAGDDRSPPWSWHTKVYHDGDRVVMPADNMMSCIRKAAQAVPYGKNSNYKALSQSGLLILGDLDFQTRKGHVSWNVIEQWRENDTSFADQSDQFTKADPDCTLFVKRVKLNSSKNIRVRPMFKNWTIRGRIIITSAEISFETLKEFFRIAGDRVGLGDWRPSAEKSPGPYGRFEAKLTKADIA